MAGCVKTTKATAMAMPKEKIKISIDPVTRIEGHLKCEVLVKDGKVVDAWLSGGMFRGFENILIGRDPRDASQITQRICGVCPTAHSTASVRALDEAFKVKLTTNGRLVRNLILGADYLMSHVLHFYHLAALDYVDGPNTAPFKPRYGKTDLRLDKAINNVAVGQYIEALEVRRIAHEMVAIFGGKTPHCAGQVVGGTTEIPSKERLQDYLTRFKTVQNFIENKYIPTVYLVGKAYTDLLAVGAGHKNCISFGVFPMKDSDTEFLIKSGVYIDGKDIPFDPTKIKEYVKYSWFDDTTTGLNFKQGKTVPKVDKPYAYSFIKAPRYDGKPVEGGPLARIWITNPELSPVGKKALQDHFGLTANNFRDLGDLAWSIIGRHVARAEEAYIVAKAIEKWLTEAQPGKETFVVAPIPVKSEGIGITEAPRGALIHYVDIKDKKIANYQVVSATLWNANPRDDMGVRGPIEQALIGIPVPDVKNPVNVSRLIRSFDP
ncbi:Periplasmic (NiFeSe) hydrogenase large subunit [Desulfovibrionales bacterium]